MSNTPSIDVNEDSDLERVSVEEVNTFDSVKSAPENRSEAGPLDESEANPVRPYIDLGGIKLLPREGLNLRLELEEKTKRIVAVSLEFADSTLQVQPFAAPRSTGIWNEIREQIAAQITTQGGQVVERNGSLGPEIVAELPKLAGNSSEGPTRIARFIGVDGPRWLLRGVIAGKAATDPTAATLVEDLFRSIVVVRGMTPMPPRELIPLTVPANATP